MKLLCIWTGDRGVSAAVPRGYHLTPQWRRESYIIQRRGASVVVPGWNCPAETDSVAIRIETVRGMPVFGFQRPDSNSVEELTIRRVLQGMQ